MPSADHPSRSERRNSGVNQGADAREEELEWREKSGAASLSRGDGAWSGSLRVHCRACGAYLKVDREALEISCRCGAVIEIDSVGAEFPAKSNSTQSRRGFFLIAGIVLISALGGLIWHWPKESDGVEATGPPPVLLSLPTVGEARRVAEAFLLAESYEDKVAHVRFASAVGSSVRKFYGEQDSLVHQYTSLKSIDAVETSDLSFLRFVVTEPEGGRRLLAVVATPVGPKVDWPSFARHDQMGWDSFWDRSGEEEIPVRVYLELADYYNFEFEDLNAWQCYAISSPDLDEVWHGYASRGSDLNRGLRYLVKNGGRPRVILRIKRSEGSNETQRQVLISGIDQAGWIRPNALEPGLTISLPDS